MVRLRYIVLVLWAALPGIALVPTTGLAIGFVIEQLTVNDVPDQGSAVEGSHAAWAGFVVGAGFQIFEDRGAGPSQVTLGSTTQNPPQAIDGGIVYWLASDGSGIQSWDGQTIQPLGSTFGTSISAEGGRISYTRITLDSLPVLDFEVFVFDGQAHQQVTFNELEESSTAVSGTHAAWLTGTERVTGPPLDFGQNVAPTSWGEVQIFDGLSISVLDTPGVRDLHPDLNGGEVAWYGWDGHDLEIYTWDGASILQLTDNDVADRGASISDAGVAWFGWDGNDYEIFFWDGATTHQVTDDGYHQLLGGLSDSHLVWQGWDGNDYEIYRAAVPEPGSAAFLALGMVLLALRTRTWGVSVRRG